MPLSECIGLSAAEEMAALVADFTEYDEELLKGMVEDQGGDFLETRAVLRVSLTASACLAVLLPLVLSENRGSH